MIEYIYTLKNVSILTDVFSVFSPDLLVATADAKQAAQRTAALILAHSGTSWELKATFILTQLVRRKQQVSALPTTDAKVQMHLVYLKYWSLSLMSLMVYPKVLLHPNLSIKGAHLDKLEIPGRQQIGGSCRQHLR